MSKTPFELRYDLLLMAQDRLLQKYHSDINYWEISLKRDRDGNIVEQPVPRPAFPLDQEITFLAASLKNFVEEK
jgi:hypothetical protein